MRRVELQWVIPVRLSVSVIVDEDAVDGFGAAMSRAADVTCQGLQREFDNDLFSSVSAYANLYVQLPDVEDWPEPTEEDLSHA